MCELSISSNEQTPYPLPSHAKYFEQKSDEQCFFCHKSFSSGERRMRNILIGVAVHPACLEPIKDAELEAE